jgi:hypothetical protein
MVTKTSGIISATPTFWERINWTWAHSLLIVTYITQILLITPGFTGFRPVLRTIGFAFALFLLYKFRNGRERYVAYDAARFILGILIAQICLHPYNNSVASSIAQVAFYLAILSPVFWVPQLNLRAAGFESLIFLIWGFQTLSSVFGVLQVVYPGKFQPAISEVITNTKFSVDAVSITLANGITIPRPSGLSDSPGAAGAAGYYAFLMGIIIFLRYKNLPIRILGLLSSAVGLFCIYLSEIRSLLVLAVISVIFLGLVFLRTGQIARVILVWAGSAGLFFGAFSWAVFFGGKSTITRVFSLFAGSATEVYQKHRGYFLEQTINYYLPQYPLGAGLGRWGMMNYFFGDWTNPDSQSIWVEIQWTGWLLDGGIPLILAYSYAILLAVFASLKMANNRKLGDFTLWGALVFAYSISAIVNTFSYPLFQSQSGLEFWLFNAALLSAFKDEQVSLPATQR